jgi:hypothetical protein
LYLFFEFFWVKILLFSAAKEKTDKNNKYYFNILLFLAVFSISQKKELFIFGGKKPSKITLFSVVKKATKNNLFSATAIENKPYFRRNFHDGQMPLKISYFWRQ